MISENVRSASSGGLSSVASWSDDSPLIHLQDTGLGSIIKRFLEPLYFLDVTVMDPTFIGCPFSREREFIVMRHRVKCLASISPVSRFQRRFYRACAWNWRQVFFMHDDDMSTKGVINNELQHCLNWAQDRPSSRAHGLDRLDPSLASSWDLALTTNEFSYKEYYKSAWPNTAYLLNQDPSSGHGHHSGEHALFCLMANFGIVWLECEDDPSKTRWLLPTEALVTQHFPVMPFLHDKSLDWTSFNMDNPKRQARHVCSQVGNSMHCGVMSVLQLYVLSEIKYKMLPNIVRNTSLAKSALRAHIKRVAATSPVVRRVKGKTSPLLLASPPKLPRVAIRDCQQK